MKAEVKEQEYDVVVIGAGFGGPVAAKKCADAGLKTLMLERSENIGEKVISGLTIPIYGFLFGPDFIRDGNPPIERPVDGMRNYVIYDIEAGDIDIVELRIPRPVSPVFAFGYNTYCKPFCEWEAEQAVKSGAELRTSTTVVDFIKENGSIQGVVTDKTDRIKSKVVINCEGSQGLLAVKAGVRDKYPAEVISLADTYDYEMQKEDVDRVFGHTIRFCWGFDEQRIAPPLGHGNGLMVWPYRNSIHWMQDQCLRMDDGRSPNLRKLFDEYHENITTQLPWWRDEVAPRIRLRARMFEGFEIFVGLDDRLRNMPNHTDGMLLAGDAAGLESTGLCDGVPCAWFSADIAADVAIEAIKVNDTSAAFLKSYDEKIKSHPIIRWVITNTGRWNLRKAQESHNRKELRSRVHYQFGFGILTHAGTPLIKCTLQSIRRDPSVIAKWVKMFFRYYYNWEHERFGLDEPSVSARRRGMLGVALWILDAVLRLSSPLLKIAARLMEPLAGAVNPVLKGLGPLVELILRAVIKMEPVFRPLTHIMIRSVTGANPALYNVPRK
ncbi:MAG: NAD(P)/FAD-dependent oxidoreductase [Dehalococcoidia bacterium]|nr:MAG: NAD(P)/FAD-dependent oxidoreductase [Dehalococcoidia bacterium]